jgi:hypothetical protein
MTDENKGPKRSDLPASSQPNNMSELDPSVDVDPLTDERTVAQTPTADEDIFALPENEHGQRTGDFDTTTGAAHPSADSGADKGLKSRLEQKTEQHNRNN